MIRLGQRLSWTEIVAVLKREFDHRARRCIEHESFAGAVTVPSGHVVSLQQTPSSFASVRMAPSRLAAVRSALVRFALVRSAYERSAKLRSAAFRFTRTRRAR